MAHAVHCWSATVVPVMLTYVPGSQVLHGVQLIAFVVVLKVPLAHAVHVWSVVAVPLAATACPCTQLVHATHAVAGLLS